MDWSVWLPTLNRPTLQILVLIVRNHVNTTAMPLAGDRGYDCGLGTLPPKRLPYNAPTLQRADEMAHLFRSREVLEVMWQNLVRAKPTCRDVLPAACFWVLSHAFETGRGETALSLQNLGSGRGGWQERDLSLVRSPVASHHYWCLVLRQLRCVFTGCLGHGAVVWCHVACRRHHRVVTSTEYQSQHTGRRHSRSHDQGAEFSVFAR